jgi:hypothetical protein
VLLRLFAGAVISSKAPRGNLIGKCPCDRGVKNLLNFLGVIEGWRFSFWPSRLYEVVSWEELLQLKEDDELSVAICWSLLDVNSDIATNKDFHMILFFLFPLMHRIVTWKHSQNQFW